MGPYKSTSRWDWYSWGPLLIGGGVVGRCCRVAEWPASVGWRFSNIGNWFPDIGKSSTFPDIGKSISDIRKSFPDIGKSIISRYRKLISRYREFQFPISGNNSRYREMLNKNPNGFPYPKTPTTCGIKCLALKRVLVGFTTVALLITEPQNDHKTKLFYGMNRSMVGILLLICHPGSVTSLASCLSKDIYVIGGVWTWHLRRFRCLHSP